MRVGLVLGVLACGSVVASAAEVGLNSVAACLQDGYEMKTAFSDGQGGAYILLQKGTSAYMCHSNPAPRCEKLN